MGGRDRLRKLLTAVHRWLLFTTGNGAFTAATSPVFFARRIGRRRIGQVPLLLLGQRSGPGFDPLESLGGLLFGLLVVTLVLFLLHDHHDILTGLLVLLGIVFFILFLDRSAVQVRDGAVHGVAMDQGRVFFLLGGRGRRGLVRNDLRAGVLLRGRVTLRGCQLLEGDLDLTMQVLQLPPAVVRIVLVKALGHGFDVNELLLARD